MPNPWFQFKQFTIRQDRCAMKVSTDACIQGAWAAQQLKSLPAGPLRILDIGTGTGLLSLMLVQQCPGATIDALELNADAAGQAAENFRQSAWPQALQAHHTALADFLSTAGSYDFIICNPPFFHNQLQAPQQARNEARHSVSLSKDELAHSLSLLLNEAGSCCILYPEREWSDWVQTAAQYGLWLHQELRVQPSATAAINRMVGIFGKEKIATPQQEQLVIYEADRSYTPAFATLLEPYYLGL